MPVLRKLKATEPGAPLWCLTYGDLITQCMAFLDTFICIS